MNSPSALHKFYAGTSGLVLPVPNKAAYPPEFQDRSRLCYYASLFNSIEINSSFYKIPQAGTMRKWAAEVPDDFRFTFKLFQGITHQKELVYDPELIPRFMSVINEVGHKKGCLLVQFPPSFRADSLPRLDHLLNVIRHEDEHFNWDIAVEFRHKTWYNEQVYELLEKYDMGMVIHDLPASAAPLQASANNFVYLRFHGPNGGYRGSYTDAFLYEYLEYIKEWQQEGKTVYVYFNNTMGDAVKNLMVLNEYMRGS